MMSAYELLFYRLDRLADTNGMHDDNDRIGRHNGSLKNSYNVVHLSINRHLIFILIRIDTRANQSGECDRSESRANLFIKTNISL